MKLVYEKIVDTYWMKPGLSKTCKDFKPDEYNETFVFNDTSSDFCIAYFDIDGVCLCVDNPDGRYWEDCFKLPIKFCPVCGEKVEVEIVKK